MEQTVLMIGPGSSKPIAISAGRVEEMRLRGWWRLDELPKAQPAPAEPTPMRVLRGEAT